MTYHPVTKRSRLLFHWRASECSLDPITGQADSFARTANATGVTDTAGATYTAIHSQPAWQATSSEPGLLLGANDTMYWTLSAAPQTQTAYVKFVERGTVLATGDGLLLIGSATAASDPRYVVDSTGAYYRVTHDNGVATSGATLGATPTAGDTVEIRAVLNANGTTIIGQSINSAAETTASSSATAAHGSAWAGTRVYVNSTGSTNKGTNEIRCVKIAPGVKTMAEMRTAF